MKELVPLDFNKFYANIMLSVLWFVSKSNVATVERNIPAILRILLEDSLVCKYLSTACSMVLLLRI